MVRKRHRLAARRKEVGLSQENLAEAVGVDRSTVVRWEHADTDPQPWHRPRIARALDVSVEALAEMLDERGQPPAQPVPFDVWLGGHQSFAGLAAGLSSEPGEVDPMRRRTVISGLMGFGAATGLALESTRHGLHTAFVADRVSADADEWDEIVWEHARRYRGTPAAEFLQMLTTDLIAIQGSANAGHDDHTLSRLCRSAAMLAVFSAMTVANLGDLRQAGRWWRTARRLADQTGDPSTIAWTRGMEIIRAQYERRPLGVVLDLVEQAEPIAATAPVSAQTEFVSGKAQALAMAGRPTDARAALHQVLDVFDRMPDDVTGDHDSLFGFPPESALYVESYVYSYLGDFAAADTAQQTALRMYPPENRRQPAQIGLQRALCLAMVGDVTESVAQAGRMLTELPSSDHVRPVLDLGQRVLEAVSADDRDRPDVAAYRELLNQAGQPRSVDA
jgi:DNA-binding XRE family transcriptional regulator